MPTDLRHPWLTAGATLALGAIHSSVSQRTLGGRRPTPQLSVRADVAGRRAPLLVIAGLVGLALVTVVVALAASADGARHPVTMASIVVALLIFLGGPRLMATIRNRAARSSMLP